MSTVSPRFIIDDLNELLNEKPSWNFTLESNSGIDPALLIYNDCVAYLDCRTINPDVATDVDENGAWNYRLYNLEKGGTMSPDVTNTIIVDTLFYDQADMIDIMLNNAFNMSLKSFNIPLPKLIDGSFMFSFCPALTTFKSDLSKLADGYGMFSYCIALESFTSDLSNLTDGISMFAACSSLTSFNSDLSKLTDGKFMFNGCSNLTSFTSDLTKLANGDSMFYDCSSLTSFNSDLSKLTVGYEMFKNCTSLTSFNSDLSSLTYAGDRMFENCAALTSFNSDLSKLTVGYYMFSGCSSLTSFNSDLSNLDSGEFMFYNCAKLTSFNSNLPKMTYGEHMFDGCTNLTSFNGDLSSMTHALYMFHGCKLDTASVQNIASTIRTPLSGEIRDKIHIGIGNSTPNAEEETAFNTIKNKGWTVYVNGSSWTPTNPTSVNNLTDEEEQSAPIPFYAKPIQVTEDEAEYVDANNNYYNIVGGQFIYGDDLSTYGIFTSHEHAVEEISIALGLTKYTKPAAEKQQRQQHTLNALLMSNLI